jgi:hypothetical protein
MKNLLVYYLCMCMHQNFSKLVTQLINPQSINKIILI